MHVKRLIEVLQIDIMTKGRINYTDNTGYEL
jgi:hypothetical protein